MIHITVNKQSLTAVTDEPLVAKTVGIVTFDVEFSGDWDDFEKTVVFAGKGGTKPVLYLGGEMEVPWEPLDKPGYLYISAVGMADGKRDVTAMIDYPQRIYPNGDLGDDPTELPPSPTELEQAVLACARSAKEARAEAEKAEEQANTSKLSADRSGASAEEALAGAAAAEQSRLAAEEANRNAQFFAGQAQEGAAGALVSREGAEETAKEAKLSEEKSAQKALAAEEQAKKAAQERELAGQEREAAAREAQAAGQARAGAEQALADTRTTADKMVEDAGKIVESVRPDIDKLYAALIRDTMTGPIVHGEFVPDTPLDYRIDIEATREGEGDPSPENVRSIVGVDSVKVTVCGRNLLNPANIDNYYDKIYRVEHGVGIIDNTSSSRSYPKTAFIHAAPGDYTLNAITDIQKLETFLQVDIETDYSNQIIMTGVKTIALAKKAESALFSQLVLTKRAKYV